MKSKEEIKVMGSYDIFLEERDFKRGLGLKAEERRRRKNDLDMEDEYI